MKLINLIKYNKCIYYIYFYVMSFFVNFLKLFVIPNDKILLFNSFAGRKFDDSPKALFDAIKKDKRFTNYRLIWAFHEPDKFVVDGAEKIKTNGFLYFKTALAARVWITNSSVERGLSFKGKKTLYLNTWHGSPIKKMGSDIDSNNLSFKSKSKNLVDYMNTQSLFEAEVFSRCFNIPRENFLEVGLPRNDILKKYTSEYREKIRKQLGISEDKKVILYCPTFREYEKDENLGVVLTPPLSLEKWNDNLSANYVFLFRAHYEVCKVMNIEENEFVKNVTNYPILNDLMIASDILISDYSSIFFDYSIMDKCMLHFTYDYDKYSSKRGMYFDIRDYINGASFEDDLIHILSNLNEDLEIKRTQAFRNKYVNFCGNATDRTVDFVADMILEKE